MSKKQDLAVADDLMKQMALAAQEEAAESKPSVGSISLRSGVMKYMDEIVPNNTMDVVITGAAIERALYTTAFDPDNITPPDCYALALKSADLAPAANVPNPRHDTCAFCPNDEWGSGRGKGKACGERRRLLVIPADAAKDPDAVSAAEMAILKIPVTSIKNWNNYVNKLSATMHRPTWAVVTTIKVVPDPKTQFKVTFELAQPIEDNQVLLALAEANKGSEAYTMTPFDMDVGEETEEVDDSKIA